MGLKSKEIVTRAGVDTSALIKLLHQAFCDEWLSYYQYWIGARIAMGKLAPALIPELNEHAADELEHAEKLAKRLAQLDAEPVISPTEWLKLSTCGYAAPVNPNAVEILLQNLHAERCAIEVYEHILNMVKGKDLVTEHVIREILEDEVEHETELQNMNPCCDCEDE